MCCVSVHACVFSKPHTPALRILRVSDSSQAREIAADHKFVVGRGGARIESSRNFWEGSGLKIDSAITDVAWAHGGEQILVVLYTCHIHSIKLSQTRF